MISPFKFLSFLRFSVALGRHSLALLPEAAVFVVLSSVGLARFVPAAWRASEADFLQHDDVREFERDVSHVCFRCARRAYPLHVLAG